MEKLGVQGPFQLVGQHIHTKLWKLVPWYLVRLGNPDGDTGLPWGFTQPFGNFQGALWCCGHTEARQNNRHAQPQASKCRLDGAIPRSEVESKVRPNTGSPPPRWVFFRAGENWALSQSQPWATWHVICGFSSALFKAGSRSSGVNRLQM